MEQTLVLGIVEAAGVFASGDDGGISVPGGIVMLEDIFDFSLHLIFIKAGSHRLETTTEGLRSDVAGLLRDVDLFRRLDHALGVEDRGSATILMHGVKFLDPFDKTPLDGLHCAFIFWVFVAVQEKSVAIA